MHDLTYSDPSQVSWACAALLSGRTIGHHDEITEAKGWRLAAIVWRLKHRYGWPISTEYVGPENRACYKLEIGLDRTKLRLPPSAKDLGDMLALAGKVQEGGPQ
jgi:hypothetical protein